MSLVLTRPMRTAAVLVTCLTQLGVACCGEKVSGKPEPYTEKIPGSLASFEMVAVPGGEISFPDAAKHGSEISVKVSPFWISKTELTWDCYDTYAIWKNDEHHSSQDVDAVSRPSRPYGEVDRGYGRAGYPVISVTYCAAEQFCAWLSKKTGRNYRLPTEAEWEYACRAGQSQPDRKSLAKYAWFGQEKTNPVARKLPNAWGLYDTIGNVAEWCVGLNGKPVACGGSFRDSADKVGACARQVQDDSWQANDPQCPKSKWWLSDGDFVGFRVVCTENPCANPR